MSKNLIRWSIRIAIFIFRAGKRVYLLSMVTRILCHSSNFTFNLYSVLELGTCISSKDSTSISESPKYIIDFRRWKYLYPILEIIEIKCEIGRLTQYSSDHGKIIKSFFRAIKINIAVLMLQRIRFWTLAKIVLIGTGILWNV